MPGMFLTASHPPQQTSHWQDYVAKLNADIEKHLENLYQAPCPTVDGCSLEHAAACFPMQQFGEGGPRIWP